MTRLRLCWMISTEGRVVVIYLGFLQPKKSWERDIFGCRSSNIVLMRTRSVTLAKCLQAICAPIQPCYILLSLPIPLLSGGLILWIVAQLWLGGIITLLWLSITSQNGKRICPQWNPIVRQPRISFSTRLSPSSTFWKSLSLTVVGSFRKKWWKSWLPS